MSGKLLDTNIIIKIINGNQEIAQVLEKIADEDISIPIIVYGELIYGAEKSNKKDYNSKLFSEFCSNYQFAYIDVYSAETYGKIKNQLMSKGVNIPENDIWIASIAIANDFELLSCDRHFENIDSLKLQRI